MFSFFNGFNRKIISLNPKSKQCHNVCQWNWMICKNIIIAIFTQSKELKKLPVLLTNHRLYLRFDHLDQSLVYPNAEVIQNLTIFRKIKISKALFILFWSILKLEHLKNYKIRSSKWRQQNQQRLWSQQHEDRSKEIEMFYKMLWNVIIFNNLNAGHKNIPKTLSFNKVCWAIVKCT